MRWLVRRFSPVLVEIQARARLAGEVNSATVSLDDCVQFFFSGLAHIVFA